MRTRSFVLGLGVLLWVLAAPHGACGGQSQDVTAKIVNQMPVWEANGMTSGPADAGDPAGRLTVKVKLNDTVRFQVEGGLHGVIFENAKAEQDKVWKVVPNSGALQELDDVDNTIPAYFDRQKALTTAKKQTGELIEIEIVALKPGDTILFACAQHSRGGGATGKQIHMLGAIALEDGKDGDKRDGTRPVPPAACLPETKIQRTIRADVVALDQCRPGSARCGSRPRQTRACRRTPPPRLPHRQRPRASRAARCAGRARLA